MLAIKSITKESLHPLSQLIAKYYFSKVDGVVEINKIENFIGKGTKAICGDIEVLIGSASFFASNHIAVNQQPEGSVVCLAINNQFKGVYKVNHTYREGISTVADNLKKLGYQLHLLSGDHPAEKNNLIQILGTDVTLLFEQSPIDKLNYIQQLQSQGRKVMMVGDGLNDAGALQKSNVGVAVTDQSHLFTPASDAILAGEQMSVLDALINYAKKAKLIIILIFSLSIIYNMVGMYFATSAQLSPMVAAILMPISSISIVALSALLSYLVSSTIRSKN